MPGDPSTGFFGKLPARGDFLRAGLPRSFTDPLDDWLSRVLVAGRAALGERWEEVWPVAPVWRFALSPGICGPTPAVGVLLPSADRVGRAFPLVIARLAPASDPGSAEFLEAAARAGRVAITTTLAPEALRAMLMVRADEAPLPLLPDATVTLWWSEGRRLTLPGLPDGETFIAMLQPVTEDP